MEEYTKLAKTIIYSSIWGEDGDTCKVWVTFLALKDKDGIVKMNVTGIARIANLPLKKCEQAIRKFESPDPNSSSDADNGKRIRKLKEGGWQVINHLKYWEYGWSDEKKEYERRRKADWRSKKREPSKFSKSTGGAIARDVAIAWAEASRKNGSDYTDREAVEAWLYYESKQWKDVSDYRTALELQITRTRRWTEENKAGKTTPENPLWNKKLD